MKNHKHNLKEIYRYDERDHSEVVRWCEDCGAIVVDLEFDGRLSPGGATRMKLPKYITGGLKQCQTQT